MTWFSNRTPLPPGRSRASPIAQRADYAIGHVLPARPLNLTRGPAPARVRPSGRSSNRSATWRASPSSCARYLRSTVCGTQRQARREPRQRYCRIVADGGLEFRAIRGFSRRAPDARRVVKARGDDPSGLRLLELPEGVGDAVSDGRSCTRTAGAQVWPNAGGWTAATRPERGVSRSWFDSARSVRASNGPTKLRCLRAGGGDHRRSPLTRQD